jgi:hypothetical protein
MNDTKIHNLKTNVDLVINRTEESLLRGTHKINSVLHHQASTKFASDLLSVDVVRKQVDASSNSIRGDADWIPKPSDDDVIVIFSTDCSPYQDWQSLVLFHSAKRVKQKGNVIRIASGCTEEQQKKLTDIYYKLYQGYYYAHFTPDFKKDAKTKKKCTILFFLTLFVHFISCLEFFFSFHSLPYHSVANSGPSCSFLFIDDFYNKPWGLKHWLENSEHPIPDNAIIALLDPDMIFLRPLTPYIKSQPYIISKRIPKDEIIDRIGEGHPVSQQYGLGISLLVLLIVCLFVLYFLVVFFSFPCGCQQVHLGQMIIINILNVGKYVVKDHLV